MLTYRATIPLSTRTLTRLAELLRARRRAIGSRWRRLDPGQQALLVPAHLRNGDTRTRLAGGFDVSATTAWRYIREAVDLLAAAAPTLEQAMRRIGRLAYAILDGTLIPIDRLGGSQNRRYFSGKHRRHGVNAQVVGDPHGRLMWVSPALPRSIHDLKAARTHGLIDALTGAAVATFADKGYRGARGAVAVPFTAATCPCGCVRSTPPTPRSVQSVNARSRRSRPGRCWPSCTAARSGPPRCSPRSSCFN